MAIRILVVDDEEDLCEIIQFNLEGEGFEVDVAWSAEEALKKNLGSYNIILLDIMMGKISGFKLARIIRQEMKLTTPIIFITAKDAEDYTLTGFSLGADDYIKKPFSIRELIARVKAVVQRTGIKEGDGVKRLRFSELEIDPHRKQLRIGDNPVDLTRKEYDIIHYLIDNNNRICSREEIFDRVWGYDVIVSLRTVDVHIARLRKKLGSFGRLINNRPGYGYYLDAAAE